MIAFALVRRLGSGRLLEKRIHVLVADVGPGRKDDYRSALLKALKPLGPTARLKEDPDEVAVAVTTSRSLADARKKASACRRTMQFRSAVGVLRYISLEAAAEMVVAIKGRATPGSRATIGGVRTEIEVASSGSFAVQVPLSLLRKHESQGYIPAKCRKGNMEEDIRISIPK